MRLRWMFAPWSLLAIIVAVFVLWQVFLFIQPRPQPFSDGEQRAARQVAGNIVQTLGENVALPARVAVTHFSGDRQRQFAGALRAALQERPDTHVIETALIQKLLTDIAVVVAEATSIEEILRAGQYSDIDVILAGRLLEIQTIGDQSRITAHVMAYDTRPGVWVFKRDFQGQWQPPPIERLGNRIRELSAAFRFLLWLVFVLVLPWILPWPTWWAVRRQSNAAGFAVVGGFTLAGIAWTLIMTAFSVQGAWAVLRLLLAILILAVYNFLVCERVGARE